MKKILLSSVVCASMMLAADSQFEITPMIGGVYTEGNLDLERNYGDAGIALGWNQEDSFIDQVELGFLRSLGQVNYVDSNDNKTGAKTNVTRLFANLIKDFPLTSNLSLYGLVGLGGELFDNESAKNNDGYFANYGAGLKYAFAESMALKFDLRHAISLSNDGNGTNGNNLLYTLGLAIPFGAKAVSSPKPVQILEVVETVVDSDGDGVADVNDSCPDTVPGAIVNAQGCELDDDNDGVVNRLDQCPNTMAGAEVDTIGCMTLVDLQINFKTNSSVIDNSYGSRVAQFAEVMNNNPKLNATIKGYTDSVGAAKYNQKLSERRANSTVSALKALNVDSSRLSAIGYGEQDPIATNKTKEGRAANRRVIAVINK